MKILVGHNHYQRHGGEDAVVDAEIGLLKQYGNEVQYYQRSNDEIEAAGFFSKIEYLMQMNWAQKSYREVKRIIKTFRPDIAHFHNIFYMISPSVYWACQEERVPVVQSLHNFRLLCSNALFYRNGKTCEDCMQKSLWQGVYHKCFRSSYLQTFLMARLLMKHWRKGTWLNFVDAYITLSPFSRQKYIQGGLPAHKIFVKPNFEREEVAMAALNQEEDCVLYVGRLSVEKGVDVLLKAWQKMATLPLKIIGDGPLFDRLKQYASERHMANVTFLGRLDNDECRRWIRRAKFIVVPSVCYENFPRFIVEAFACGVPVLASRIGSLQDIVEEGKTGLFFKAGDPDDLAQKAQWMITHDEAVSEMCREVKRTFDSKYTDHKNYEQLMAIYRTVIEHRRKKVYVHA